MFRPPLQSVETCLLKKQVSGITSVYLYMTWLLILVFFLSNLLWKGENDQMIAENSKLQNSKTKQIKMLSVTLKHLEVL